MENTIFEFGHDEENKKKNSKTNDYDETLEITSRG